MLFFVGCSINNPLRSARKFNRQKNYVAAIEHYDNFLGKSNNLELKTVAEIERAECYYYLGLRAVEKENWLLGSKLLFLSNSEEADEELDLCYQQLALAAYDEGDSVLAISYFQKIKDYLGDSELREDALVNIISYYHEVNDDSTAFENYLLLVDEYENNNQIPELSNDLNVYIVDKAEKLFTEADSSNFSVNYEELLALMSLPIPGKGDISNIIGDYHKQRGDYLFANNNFIEAFSDYHDAEQYNEQLKEYHNTRKEDYIKSILDRATNLEMNGDFEYALAALDEALAVFPDNSQVKTKKLDLNRKVYNAELAENAFVKAEEYNSNGNYAQALEYYRQSNSYLHRSEVKDKIELMENLIKAEENPKAFALEIITSYKNGLLNKGVNETFSSAINEFGSELTDKSDWKVLFYSGEYKFEVRNDILTPGDSFYFAWMVDLSKRAIVPLNKLSENLMEGTTPYEE